MAKPKSRIKTGDRVMFKTAAVAPWRGLGKVAFIVGVTDDEEPGKHYLNDAEGDEIETYPFPDRDLRHAAKAVPLYNGVNGEERVVKVTSAPVKLKEKSTFRKYWEAVKAKVKSL